MRFIKRHLTKINIALFVVNSILAGGLLGAFGAFETTGNVALSLILRFVVIIVGMYLSLSVHLVCHELGHLFAGIKAKYTFLSFAVGPLSFEKEGNKTVLKWRPFNGIGGLCRMFPSSGNTAEDFAKYIKGGLIASAVITGFYLLIFALSLVLSQMAFFKWLAIAFALAFPLSLYILLNNMANVKLNNAMTDGAYLASIKNKDNSGIALINVINYQSYISSGVRPKDVPKEIIESIPAISDDDGVAAVVASNVFSYYMDIGDVEKIARATQKIADVLPYSAEVYSDDLKADLLYGYSVIGMGKEAAEIFEELKDKTNFSALRSLSAYKALVEKDKEGAKEYGKKALDLITHIPLKGMIESEKEILLRLMY